MAGRNFGECTALFQDECGVRVFDVDARDIAGNVGAYCAAGALCMAPENDVTPAVSKFKVVPPHSGQVPGDSPVTFAQVAGPAEGGQR